MTAPFSRRHMLAAAGTGFLAGLPLMGASTAARAQGLPPPLKERVLGDPAAPVTVIEYHSLSCGNCAKFYLSVMPQVKKEFIDTGKVKFAYRDFPLDGAALNAAIIAHCSGEDDRYFAFIDVFYRQKEQWAHDKEPLKRLATLAALGGIPPAKLKACQDDKAFVEAILQQRVDGEREFKVQATPTFVIEGKTYRGAMEFEEFAKLLRPLIKG